MLSLDKAIVARINASEVVTGDTLVAQSYLNTLFGGTPTIRKDYTPSETEFPCLTFATVPAPESLGGAAIGQVQNVVVRFFIWTKSRGGSFVADVADTLEHLFNMQRGASALSLAYNDVFKHMDLFTDLQEPNFDRSTNDFSGMIAFRFVVARP